MPGPSNMPKSKIGLMPWVLVQTGLPHGRQLNADGSEAKVYERKNGQICLTMQADVSADGLPFGKMPRMLMAHLVVEFKKANKNKTFQEARTIDLGRSQAMFLKAIGSKNTGGKKGMINRLQQQTHRLTTCNITTRSIFDDDVDIPSWKRASWDRRSVADSARLWWNPTSDNPKVQCLFPSYIRLSEYFAEACQVAIPVDMHTMIALKSSFAIDLYTWLSYRAGKLWDNGDPPAEIPWPLLMLQFGHNYAREVDFRKAFRKYLGQVIQHHPVRVDHKSWPKGIVVYPHPPHVKRRKN